METTMPVKDWSKPIRSTDERFSRARHVATLKGVLLRRLIVMWDARLQREICITVDDDDLGFENVPEMRELWVNVYRIIDDPTRQYAIGCIFMSQEAAESSKDKHACDVEYLATVKVYEEEVAQDPSA